jgi:hypothetical protein
MAHTFNGTTKRIIIDSSLPDVDIKELYSDWKEWALQSDNLQYLQAFRTFGGDPTVEGQTAPAYYFLMNRWRIVVDGFDAVFSYNLYTDEGENPIITLNGGTALLNNSDVGIIKTELDQSLDYEGVVWVDFIDGQAGQSYPLGTSADPINNIADAVAVGNNYGINHIRIIKGNGTANVFMPNYIVEANNPQATVITIMGDLTDPTHIGNYRNTKFINLTLTGTACGCNWYAEGCLLKDVYQVAGLFDKCGFIGTVGLSSRIDEETGEPFPSIFYQCVSGIAGFASPTLDMVLGLPTQTSIRAYSGGLTLENADHPQDVASIEFTAGKLHVQPSCTNGEVSVRGVVKIVDNGGGIVIDDSATVSKLVDLSNVTIGTGDIHNALDSYANKDDWKATTAEVNLQPVLDAITGLNNLSLLDIEGSTVLAKEVTLNAIATSIAAIPTTNVDVNLIPVLDAISSLNDVTPAEVRAAFNAADFKDKNTETEIHNWLDSYTNKNLWKASTVNLQPVLDAIASLNDLALVDIENSNVLAKDTALSNIANAVSLIPTTDSVADITPVLNAIANLNDVSASEVRAAFDIAEFKDKNTEAEVHAWLDSYANKSDWSVDPDAIREKVWSKVV